MRIRLSTDALPERDRLAYWREAICQEIFAVTAAQHTAAPDFRAALDLQMAGHFVLAELRCSHGGIQKTAGDAARAAADSVLLYLGVGPTQRFRLGQEDFTVAPGDVCIVPLDRRYEGAAAQLAFRSLVIPAAVLAPLIGRRELTRAHHLAADSPLGILLGSSLTTLAAQLPRLEAPLAEAVLANLTGLVALALGATEQGRAAGRDALRQARLDKAKRHVARHLADPALSPASTAAALGMSLRQLHLLFGGEPESFARHLLRRRLEACRATLADPAAAGRPVADIAFGWGFASLSVFYRCFAEAYGVAPASLRPAHRG